MYTGLGLAFLTKEKIEKAAKELIEKGKMTEKEGKEYIHNISKESEEAGRKLEDKIEEGVKKALKKMHLVTLEEYTRLVDKIKELEIHLKKNQP
mgnify:CR=1 FL=1